MTSLNSYDAAPIKLHPARFNSSETDNQPSVFFGLMPIGWLLGDAKGSFHVATVKMHSQQCADFFFLVVATQSTAANKSHGHKKYLNILIASYFFILVLMYKITKIEFS